MDSRYYPGVEADVPALSAELRNVFDSEYEVQAFQVSTTSIIQARKSNTLRDLTGLSSALTIKITPESGGTRVEIGMQKWFDKAAVAAVGDEEPQPGSAPDLAGLQRHLPGDAEGLPWRACRQHVGLCRHQVHRQLHPDGRGALQVGDVPSRDGGTA